MIVYLYDLKAPASEYNKVKRNFYYHLNRNGFSRYFWETKSVLVVPDEHERALDSFFSDFGRFVVAYKLRTDALEELK